MKKRILSIILVLAMCLTLLPMTAFAADDFTITNGTPESAEETNHGYITVNETAADGDTVTITVNPADGYQLKSLTVAPTGFVDLGIKDTEGKPLYWKETNLGAGIASDPGDYYMWGATALMYSAVDRSKTSDAFTFVTENPYGDNYKNTWDASLGFNFNNVPFADGVFKNTDGERNVFTKYTTIDKYAKSGTPDNITTLQPEDDAATAKNANWHTPTYDEFVALSKNCVLVWTDSYNSTGNAGYIVYKAKNDADKGKANVKNGTWNMWDAANSTYIANTGSEPTGYSTSDIHIFLPAAGLGSGKNLNNLNKGGTYWSGTLSSSNATAYALATMGIGISLGENQRLGGASIRPVMNFSGITPAKQDDVTYTFTMPGYAVTVTAEFAVTIADILPSNFPASDEDNSWCNSENDNVYIYKTDSNLVFNDSTEDCYSVPLSSPLTKEENPEVSYVYSIDGTEIQFNMTGDDDDELESIVVNNCTIPTCIGTYAAPKAFSVTYSANGATSGSAPANQTKEAGVDLTLAANTGSLAKAGYTFAGWNTKADGSGIHYDTGATYTTDAALTLYAEWIVTIADVLAKAENDFPTYSWPLPDNVWVNENCSTSKMYIANNGLTFGGVNTYSILSKPVTKDGDNYKYILNQYTITFVMNSDKLVKVITEGATNADDNGEYIPTHTHNDITFTAWTDATELPETAGNYYLTNDITISESWTVSNEINLCLNGHNIVRNGGNCITINNGGVLTVFDCSNTQHKFSEIADAQDPKVGLWVLDEENGTNIVTGGCIMGINPVAGQIDGIGVFINQGGTLNLDGGNVVGNYASNGAAGVFVGGAFTMNGGSVCGNKADSNGGGVYVSGTFTMSGGSIDHNKATTGGGVYTNNNVTIGDNAQITGNESANGGGGVHNNAGTLTLKGGTISNNTTGVSGGGVFSNAGTFNMEGGTISGNQGTYSGGVLNDKNSTFNMTGGTISNNMATDNVGGVGNVGTFKMTGGTITGNKCGSNAIGGGVWHGDGTFTLGGTAEITGNTKSDDTANNLYLNGTTVTLGTSTNGTDGNKVLKPADGMKVGVTTQTAPTAAAPVKITTNGTADDVKWFTPDNNDYKVQKNSTEDYLELALKAKTIADILATVENFPTTAENGWVNENGLKMYSDMNLAQLTMFAPGKWNLVVPHTTGVALSGSNYVCVLTGEMTFVMENNVLVKVIVSGSPEAIHDGTYAPPAPVTYTVTFNMNGHGAQIEAQTVESGSKATKPAVDPTAEGWTFGGWYADEALSTEFNFGSVINADTTIYAKWTKNTPAPSGGSTPTVTVPVSGDENSVKVSASVSGSTATVKEIKNADLEKVVGGESVEIDLTGLKKDIDTAKIPTATVEKIGEQAGMSVKLTTATVAFDKTATQEISDQAKGNTVELVVDDIKEVSLNAVQKEAVQKLDTALIIDAYLVSGGTKLCTEGKGGFNGGKATVMLPYEIKNNRSAANYNVFYVDDTGKLEKLAAKYDVKLGAFVFDITHFSNYVVAYDENACLQDATCVYAKFTDADTKAWYHDGVHFCVENGYMQGVSDTKFAPSGTLSRGMIVTMLWRLEGEPVVNYAMTFKDVKADQWYTEAIRWAQSTGVVDGYSADAFGPSDDVTREQLAAILYNYAKLKGQGFTGSWMFLLDFVDRADISSWADEAVHWCSMKGIVNGKTENGSKVFDPQGKATRAEAASMVQRFCEAVSAEE